MPFFEILNDAWYLVLTFLYVGILHKSTRYFFSISFIILLVGALTYVNGFLLLEPYSLSLHLFQNTFELHSLTTFLVTFGIPIGILLCFKGITCIRLGIKMKGSISTIVGISLLTMSLPLVLEIITVGIHDTYGCTHYVGEMDTNYFFRFFFTQLLGSHLALYLYASGIGSLSKKSKYPRCTQSLMALLICTLIGFFAIFMASNSFFCEPFEGITNLIFTLIILFVFCTFCISISYLITWYGSPKSNRWNLLIFGFLFPIIISIGGACAGFLYLIALAFGGD